MSVRQDYQKIGDLVFLCAQTMRTLSARQRSMGNACPFKPSAEELERLSREIKSIAKDLPAEWDRGALLNS